VSADVFLALVTFAFVSSVTPGPNNFMLLASGVNFGWRRTIPHIAGISIGFLALTLAIGFGIGALINAYPQVGQAMKIASAVYLLYLAWRIAFAGSMKQESEGEARPLTFMQAAAFQWVNPKAWAISLVAMAAYVSVAQPILSILVVAFTFAAVNLPAISIWVGFGIALRQFLLDPKRLRIFNIVMGLALVATIWPILSA
jgi:threonine/homoserine/homoserine lactone efflux protein